LGTEPAIDWDAVRARLARVAAATHPTADHERRILRQRARALAAPPPRAAPATTVSVLGFTLAGAPHAVETRHVREIVRLVDLTPVPGAPDTLLGLVPVRGEVVAVFDLRRLLALEGRGAPPSRLVVLGGEHLELAVAVDAVNDITLVDLATLREPPIAGSLVRGLTADTVLLDGAALLSDPRTQLDEA
jgi:purine-binding chemotaxis protein CheW